MSRGLLLWAKSKGKGGGKECQMANARAILPGVSWSWSLLMPPLVYSRSSLLFNEWGRCVRSRRVRGELISDHERGLEIDAALTWTLFSGECFIEDQRM